MSKDSVPNIRFNVCKILTKMYKICDNGNAAKDIDNVLKTLLTDEDRDVRHFAKVGLAEIAGEQVQ